MAKELMEIGGFITSGAEIVNHDASLSGNGTVDSPLGLNETVLWSGTRRSSVTLSESAYNFEFIRIELDEGSSNAPNPVITIRPTNLMTFSFGFGDANAFIAIVKATLTNNTSLEFTASKALKFGSFTSTQVSITAELNSDQVTNSIVKVVGINRIANN